MLFIHSQISTAEPLKFDNGLIISSYTFRDMGLLIQDGIKVKPCQEKKSHALKSSRGQAIDTQTDGHTMALYGYLRFIK